MDGPVDELKELVKISLQQSGALGSIKAQLRAAVFKVVNQEGSSSPAPKESVLSTSEGALAVDLVREFLEWHQLQSSLAVLVPEAQLDGDAFPGRSSLAERLDLANSSPRPLLVELLAAHMKRGSAPGSENVRPGSDAMKGAGSSSLGGGKSLLGDLPALSGKTSSPPKTAASAGGAARPPPEEEDEDEELSSTTRRVRPGSAAATRPEQGTPPRTMGTGKAGGMGGGGYASSSSSPGSADASMEARKREMMAGALSAEKVMKNAPSNLDISEDDFGCVPSPSYTHSHFSFAHLPLPLSLSLGIIEMQTPRCLRLHTK